MVRGTDARASRGPSLPGSASRPLGPRFLALVFMSFYSRGGRSGPHLFP